jgi:hypothetical protein
VSSRGGHTSARQWSHAVWVHAGNTGADLLAGMSHSEACAVLLEAAALAAVAAAFVLQELLPRHSRAQLKDLLGFSGVVARFALAEGVAEYAVREAVAVPVGQQTATNGGEITH